ncbi:MAG: hypothetical protein LLG14_16655 [Nocardiaceae bacterium]|nr:hypothetical protein [Nocardiaceae bacterium]
MTTDQPVGDQLRRRKGKREANRARAVAAIQLRASGATYPEISERLGYAGKEAAFRAVKRLLARQERESAAELVAIEDRNLLAWRRELWAAIAVASPAQLAALASTDVRISDRRGRLYGLDRPSRFEVEGRVTGGADFAATASSLLSRIAGASPTPVTTMSSAPALPSPPVSPPVPTVGDVEEAVADGADYQGPVAAVEESEPIEVEAEVVEPQPWSLPVSSIASGTSIYMPPRSGFSQ